MEVRGKKKRFTEEQVAYALAQESTGQTIAEICRKLGVSEQTFYRWNVEVRLDGGGGGTQAMRDPSTHDYTRIT